LVLLLVLVMVLVLLLVLVVLVVVMLLVLVMVLAPLFLCLSEQKDLISLHAQSTPPCKASAISRTHCFGRRSSDAIAPPLCCA
jgi:hypothetical protein